MINQANLKHKSPKLPKGVRATIYSFLCILDLLNSISKLSKTERSILQSAGEVLDQPRPLKIDTKLIRPKDEMNIRFACSICTSIQAKVSSAYAKDVFVTLQMMALTNAIPIKLNVQLSD